ncbi:MAG: bifunctional acetate--CoA ligase family protein/GNAT family N-acetyltransferase [Deltaproteobacteria bacterium]|nr:bifunctional acetate--CoA ligase family protein/GNAT family N-acetyltransferase [Deltaproteobacteria bacterium]
MSHIQVMFDPKTIALIGATEKRGAFGRAILENLLRSKERRIFPVNPLREKVLDVKSYHSITSVPEHVNLAVVATPARSVPEVVEECGQAGVEGVLIISSGFKEIGEEGKRLESEVHRIRNKYGMRILGPNCLGFVRPPLGLNATFLRGTPPPGNIAFISQSGALGSAILDWAVSAGIGFSMFASLGSMIDVDFGDMIDFLGGDEATKSILIYMEGVGNARKFISAAREFARRKPIIILKPGRFAESARAAHSHTGAMAGDDAVYEAAFRRTGIVRVREIAELFDAAKVLDSKRLPAGPRLAIVTAAGGPGVMATDALIDLGGELAKLSDESMKQLNAFLPSYWSKANPVDVLGGATVDRITKALTICLSDPMVDGALVIYVPMDSAPSNQVAQAVVDIARNAWKPIIATWMGAKDVEEGRRIFVENNIPNYDTPEEAVRTYVNMCRYKRHLDQLYETPAELPAHKAPSKDHLKELLRMALTEGRTLLNEEESKDFLMTYGIPVTMAHLAQSPEAAVSIAEKVGYPVVIKVVSPDISHKSDVGGVIMGIDSSPALKEAYEKLMQRVKKRAPEAAIAGVAVEKMITNVDYELILGAKKDKDFGSVILFGMGGTMAEFIKDFSIGLPPLNQTLAKMLIQDTKVHKMLQGFRGKPAADFEGLEAILVNFSNLIVDFPEIAEIDINPLAISNGGASALDARIIIDRDYGAAGRSPYPHLIITPYPTKYITPWQLSEGTEVLLRPIRPEDEPAEHEMLSSLSKETLRTRFFSAIKDISHEWLILFCNIDYDRHMAIVAEVQENGKKKIIGVARLIMNPDLTSGELAVLVHDRFQGKGLGYKFVEVLIGIAREKGLEDIRAEVLTENKRMLKILRRLGFTTQWLPGGTSEAVLKLKE